MLDLLLRRPGARVPVARSAFDAPRNDFLHAAADWVCVTALDPVASHGAFVGFGPLPRFTSGENSERVCMRACGGGGSHAVTAASAPPRDRAGDPRWRTAL
jgi:hypothetical protein